jgi:hypothetical protein
MKRQKSILIVIALLAGMAAAGCGDDGASSDFRDRGSSAISECEEHGGVSAFDDDIVICRDQTVDEERGRRAVEACRGRGGVAAFDDDIVICRDQTFHEAEEG